MRVVICEPEGMSPGIFEQLKAVAKVHLMNMGWGSIPTRFPDAFQPEVIWIRLRVRIDATVLDAAPNLRCIVTPTTGLTHLDLAECERRGIAVLSLKGETEFLQGIPATAEHTIGLILALIRKIPAACEHVRQGGWDRYQFQGRDLKGMLRYIVTGQGRVGKQVAKLCDAFGMKAVLKLADADVASIHVDLNDTTRGMCDASFFSRMKSGAYFINTSRGEVVNEPALLDALESGQLAGAALDVLCNEPEPRGPLIDYARENPTRLIITPHLGGYTKESLERCECFMADKLLRWIKAHG